MYKVTVYQTDNSVIIPCEEKINLLELLRQNNIFLSSPCSGRGICGKCKVLTKPSVYPVSSDEMRLLDNSEIKKGFRLACRVDIDSDTEVHIINNTDETHILTELNLPQTDINPIMEKRYAHISKPSLDNQKTDLQRIQEGLQITQKDYSLDLLRRVYGLARNKDGITGIIMEDELTGMEVSDTTDRFYGIAVDIGTTTIAAYLYDMSNGMELDVYSVINGQLKYGADVISRIQYASSSDKSGMQMQEAVFDCINQAVEYFCTNISIESNNIYLMVITGNTIMLHLLLGLSVEGMAKAPFIPVTTSKHTISVGDTNIKMSPSGRIICLPCISAFVGSDTVAAILASGIFLKSSISMLLDIGTNGEMALGCKDWIISCSTAAGPAFEGTNIHHGIGGIPGAVSSFKIGRQAISYVTISNLPAVGICGSGIIDVVSELLKAGIIDTTGKMQNKEELPGGLELIGERIISYKNQPAFIVVPGAETRSGQDIILTQKDVREVQNAKAAVAAGVLTLVKDAGIGINEIDNVYLAGGFGNFIDRTHAVDIGLIPEALRDKIVGIGNAAGAGAVMCLLDRNMLEKADGLAGSVKYIELSGRGDFVQEYTMQMFFYAID